MAKTKGKPVDPDATPEQREAAKIRAIPRGERTEEQKACLKELMEADGRRRFKALAGKRMERAEKALASLATCGNRASYTYSPEEATFIVERIETAFRQLDSAFTPGDNGKPTAKTYPWMS